MALAIGSPPGVSRWQAWNPQASAYPIKHIVQLSLLIRGQGAGEQLMRSLGVIDEHVEHIAVGPVGDGLAALALDREVNRSDSIEGGRGSQYVREDDLLTVARRGEKAADGIARQLPGEEQPVDRAVERELGGRAGEDEQYHVSISPNLAHDGMPTHEIRHATPPSTSRSASAIRLKSSPMRRAASISVVSGARSLAFACRRRRSRRMLSSAATLSARCAAAALRRAARTSASADPDGASAATTSISARASAARASSSATVA